MPVTTTKTVAYTLANVTADMEAARIVANLRWFVDGANCGTIEVIVQGDDFATLLLAAPQANKTRGDDIADLVYQYAIAHGLIEGSIS